jgi:hypothetical protein
VYVNPKEFLYKHGKLSYAYPAAFSKTHEPVVSTSGIPDEAIAVEDDYLFICDLYCDFIEHSK